jgi:hypothetical protein
LRILALDPGSEETGYCVFDTRLNAPVEFGKGSNDWIRGECHRRDKFDYLVIEMIASYGMPVGKTVFDTCVHIGRFVQCYDHPDRTHFLTRLDVKTHLCHSAKAKDSNVIQALKDRYGEKGTKKNPGVLYGISKDAWQALAVALVWSELNAQLPNRISA